MIVTLQQANAACNLAARWYAERNNRPFEGWGSDCTDRSKMPWFLDVMNKACLLLAFEQGTAFAALWGRCMQETGAAWYDQEQKSDEECERRYGYQTSTGQNLGNTEPGDGALFKGRGVIQLTGRANYEKAQARFNVPFVTEPDLVIEPVNAARIIVWYLVEEMPARHGWNTPYPWLIDSDLSLEEKTYRVSACINWGFFQPWNRHPAKEQIHGWAESLMYAQAMSDIIGLKP